MHLAQDGKEMHCTGAAKPWGTHSEYNNVLNFSRGQWTMERGPHIETKCWSIELAQTGAVGHRSEASVFKGLHNVDRLQDGAWPVRKCHLSGMLSHSGALT